jgi:hypothetical protein
MHRILAEDEAPATAAAQTAVIGLTPAAPTPDLVAAPC